MAAKRAKAEKAAVEQNSGGLSAASYRERRVVAVTNLSYESKEDDIKMLMEGYGRIVHIKALPGVALIEFASDLSAQDALPIEGSKIPGPFLHNRRLQVSQQGAAGSLTADAAGVHTPFPLRHDSVCKRKTLVCPTAAGHAAARSICPAAPGQRWPGRLR